MYQVFLFNTNIRVLSKFIDAYVEVLKKALSDSSIDTARYD